MRVTAICKGLLLTLLSLLFLFLWVLNTKHLTLSELYSIRIQNLLHQALSQVTPLSNCQLLPENEGKLIFSPSCPVTSSSPLTPLSHPVFEFLKEPQTPQNDAICITEVVKSYSAIQLDSSDISLSPSSPPLSSEEKIFGYFKDIPTKWRMEHLDQVSVHTQFGPFLPGVELTRYACALLGDHTSLPFLPTLSLVLNEELSQRENTCSDFFLQAQLSDDKKTLTLRRLSPPTSPLSPILSSPPPSNMYRQVTYQEGKVNLSNNAYCVNDLQIQMFRTKIDSVSVLGLQKGQTLERWVPESLEKVPSIKGLVSVNKSGLGMEEVMKEHWSALREQRWRMRKEVVMGLASVLVVGWVIGLMMMGGEMVGKWRKVMMGDLMVNGGIFGMVIGGIYGKEGCWEGFVAICLALCSLLGAYFLVIRPIRQGCALMEKEKGE